MLPLRLLLSVVAIALCVPAAAADASLSGAEQRVTLFARPTVVAWAEAALLYGTAAGAGPQDVVGIELKECGSTVWSTVVEAHVLSGGGWSSPVAPSVTSSVRAVWRRTTSAPVTIRQEAWVALEPRRSGSGFTVSVTSKRSLWRKQVEIQRRSGGAWRTVKRLRLVDSVKSSGTVSVSQARFILGAPVGGSLRAVLPESQAKPCYARSVSRMVKA